MLKARLIDSLILFVLLGATAPLYLQDLDRSPLHFHGDEGFNVVLARAAMAGELRGAVAVPIIHEPSAPFFLQGLVLEKRGARISSMRLPTAVMAWLSSVAAYVLLRQLVAAPFALLGAVLHATAPLTLFLGRLAETTGMLPLWQLLALACVVRGVRRERPLWFVAGGAAAAVGIHAYLTQMAFFVGLGVALPLAVASSGESGFSRACTAGLSYLGGVLVVMLPVLAELGSLLPRFRAVMVAPGISEPLFTASQLEIGRDFLTTLAGHVRGDTHPPFFRSAVTGLALAGGLGCLADRGRWNRGPLLASALLLAACLAPPFVVAVDRLNPRRFVLATPLLSILAALGLSSLNRLARGRLETWCRHPAGGVLALTLVFALAGQGLRGYRDLARVGSHTRVLVEALVEGHRDEDLRVLQGTLQVPSVGEGFAPELAFLFESEGVETVPLHRLLDTRDGRDIRCLIPDDSQLVEALQELLGKGAVTQSPLSGRPEHAPYRVVTIDGSALQERRGLIFDESLPGLSLWYGQWRVPSSGVWLLELSPRGLRTAIFLDGVEVLHTRSGGRVPLLLAEGLHSLRIEQTRRKDSRHGPEPPLLVLQKRGGPAPPHPREPGPLSLEPNPEHVLGAIELPSLLRAPPARIWEGETMEAKLAPHETIASGGLWLGGLDQTEGTLHVLDVALDIISLALNDTRGMEASAPLDVVGRVTPDTGYRPFPSSTKVRIALAREGDLAFLSIPEPPVVLRVDLPSGETRALDFSDDLLVPNDLARDGRGDAVWLADLEAGLLRRLDMEGQTTHVFPVSRPIDLATPPEGIPGVLVLQAGLSRVTRWSLDGPHPWASGCGPVTQYSRIAPSSDGHLLVVHPLRREALLFGRDGVLRVPPLSLEEPFLTWSGDVWGEVVWPDRNDVFYTLDDALWHLRLEDAR